MPAGNTLKTGDDANGKNQDWADAWTTYNDAEVQIQSAYVMYAVGGAALGTSIALFIVDAMKPRKKRRRVSLMLMPTPRGGAQVNASITF